jgi:comEA protein
MRPAGFSRQTVIAGFTITIVFTALLLWLTRPWHAPAVMEGWQERGSGMTALFTGAPQPKLAQQPNQTLQPTPLKKLTSKPASRLNLNQATLTELDQLPGIGPAKAQAILDYREKTGAFRKPEDLLQVKGIGAKLFESIKNEIIVE